mmetsp:Transcript_6786/g.16661  ORF Transcript_6786/g.16661 Transcript_6786/m.16661 type:complete len:211 (-) Transcript_6786:841-1473(-)
MEEGCDPLLRGADAFRLQPCNPSEILAVAGETLRTSTPICCPINRFCNRRLGPSFETWSRPLLSVPMSTKAPKSATLRIVPTTPRIGPSRSEIESDNRFTSDSSAERGLHDSTMPGDDPFCDDEVVDFDESRTSSFSKSFIRGSSSETESTKFSNTASTRSRLTLYFVAAFATESSHPSFHSSRECTIEASLLGLCRFQENSLRSHRAKP